MANNIDWHKTTWIPHNSTDILEGRTPRGYSRDPQSRRSQSIPPLSLAEQEITISALSPRPTIHNPSEINHPGTRMDDMERTSPTSHDIDQPARQRSSSTPPNAGESTHGLGPSAEKTVTSTANPLYTLTMAADMARPTEPKSYWASTFDDHNPSTDHRPRYAPLDYQRYPPQPIGMERLMSSTYDLGYRQQQTPTVNSVIISDNSVTMEPFMGGVSDDVIRWLNKFENFADYKQLAASGRLQLMKLLCKDSAADYLESLEDQTKNNYSLLRHALTQRFELPKTLQWKRAAELFTRPQGPKEPVETYMAAILNLAKKAKSADPKQILAAMINGFKPAIKLAVLQRPMDTIQEVMDSARIAEAANVESTPSADITTLTKNVADLTTLVKELVKPEAVRAVTPPRQVRFTPSTTERRLNTPPPSSPPYQPSQQQTFRQDYQQQQQRQTYSPSYPPRQQTQNWTQEDNYGPPPRQTNRNWNQRQQPNSFRQQQQQQPQRQFQSNLPMRNPSAGCSNCGSSRHQRGDPSCRSQGQQCYSCGRFNHFARMCRSRRMSETFDRPQQQQQQQ